MAKRRKRSRVPATPSRRRGGWKHISSVLYDAHGITLAEGERVTAALQVPGDAFSREQPQVEVEVRGRGSSWTVWYPNETSCASAVEVYDVDGNLKDTLLAHGWDSKQKPLVQSHFESTPGLSEADALDEAVAHARYLGADTVKIVRTR